MATESDGGLLDALPSRRRAFWWAVAALVAWLFVFVGRRYLGTFALGLFLYYSARPVNDRIEARLGGARRAALVSLLVIVLPFALLLGFVVLAVINALSRFRDVTGGPVYEYLRPYVERAATVESPEQAVAYGRELLSDAAVQGGLDTVLGVVGTLGTVLFHGFILTAFVYFMLRDDDRLATWFEGEMSSDDRTLTNYLRAVDEDLESVYFGQMLTVFVVIVITVVFYFVWNVVVPPAVTIPRPLLLAALTGVATLIPVVGRGVMYTLILGYLVYAAATTDPTLLWYPLVYYILTFFGLDNLVRYFVRPQLAGRDVPASLLLFSYMLGAGIWGWYGVFLAPLLFVLAWEFLRTVFPRLVHGRPLAAERPPPDVATEELQPHDDEAGGTGASSDDG
jgi:predicted PurR-regulated permease PerM